LRGENRTSWVLKGLGVLLIALFLLFTVMALTNYKNVGNLVSVVRLVQAEYLEQVDAGILIEGAIKGMVEALDDPYSSYLDPEILQRFHEQIEMSFGGLGIVVGYQGENLIVRKVFEDSPAEQSGILAGDIILEVDGTSTIGMDLEIAVGLMRGEVGTKVELVLRREGEPVRTIVTRATIHTPTVDAEMLDDGIGYLTIYMFAYNTGSETTYAINSLEEQGMISLILDLRGNPGGELNAAITVADLFVENGPIVHIDHRAGTDKTHYANGHAINVPLVVLVDENSASAAEIVAGAVKDTGAGKLVGMKTYGKGVVQAVFPLADESGLKLTTARYLTPDRHDLNRKGVAPDVVVELDPGTETDVQLETAISLLKAGNM